MMFMPMFSPVVEVAGPAGITLVAGDPAPPSNTSGWFSAADTYYNTTGAEVGSISAPLFADRTALYLQATNTGDYIGVELGLSGNHLGYLAGKSILVDGILILSSSMTGYYEDYDSGSGLTYFGCPGTFIFNDAQSYTISIA
jgi:hypothetical protein